MPVVCPAQQSLLREEGESHVSDRDGVRSRIQIINEVRTLGSGCGGYRAGLQLDSAPCRTLPELSVIDGDNSLRGFVSRALWQNAEDMHRGEN